MAGRVLASVEERINACAYRADSKLIFCTALQTSVFKFSIHKWWTIGKWSFRKPNQEEAIDARKDWRPICAANPITQKRFIIRSGIQDITGLFVLLSSSSLFFMKNLETFRSTRRSACNRNQVTNGRTPSWALTIQYVWLPFFVQLCMLAFPAAML
jgi:hypothetical protein